MLLILIIMIYFMFNLTYLFAVLILVFVVIYLSMFFMMSMIYIKFLIMMVYVSGVVVFILYISCLCWNNYQFITKIFFLFIVLNSNIFDLGVEFKLLDVGEYMWMYLFLGIMFSLLVTVYSLNLFKMSGSLRF